MWAVTNQASDGSTVAGFVAGGSDQFVDVSGHRGTYSGATVDDSDPIFDFASGELWWNRDGHMWSAAPSGGTPQDHGPGHVAGFTRSGDPSPASLETSPSGNVLAITDSQGLPAYIGLSRNFNGSCLQKAARRNRGDLSPYETAGQSYYPAADACPGVAGAVDPPDCQYVGLISDKTYACFDASNGVFESVPFSVESSRVHFGSPTPLTPATQRNVQPLDVSSDGATLWYVVDGDTLYEVPTSSNTQSPQSYSPQLAVNGRQVSVAGIASDGASDGVTGWYDNGRFIPKETHGGGY